MLNVVAKRLLGEVSWGLKMRVIMGAGLSIMDMATDIFVIWGYMNGEETKGYGWSLLGMVVVSMAFQLLLVFMQNSKKPWALMKEVLVVLTFMKVRGGASGVLSGCKLEISSADQRDCFLAILLSRTPQMVCACLTLALLVQPAVDSYRVCAGQEMEEHHVFDAKMELAFSKCCEIVAESIPGTLLQLYVLLKVRNVSRAAVGSVIVSAMTTGFSSATISFE